MQERHHLHVPSAEGQKTTELREFPDIDRIRRQKLEDLEE
jgi:hypothetical protein